MRRDSVEEKFGWTVALARVIRMIADGLVNGEGRDRADSLRTLNENLDADLQGMGLTPPQA